MQSMAMIMIMIPTMEGGLIQRTLTASCHGRMEGLILFFYETAGMECLKNTAFCPTAHNHKASHLRLDLHLVIYHQGCEATIES
eukprot:scaffold6905_cov80-Skeletonema_marinoi.AAC.2